MLVQKTKKTQRFAEKTRGFAEIEEAYLFKPLCISAPLRLSVSHFWFWLVQVMVLVGIFV